MTLLRCKVLLGLFLVLSCNAFAITTRYVNGLNGNDSNNCLSSTTACKTIGHAISLAASGDTIRVAVGTYKENLIIGINLNVIGSGAPTTIIDGGSRGSVIAIPSASAHVALSGVTLTHGAAKGGGIFNAGTLAVRSSVLTANSGRTSQTFAAAGGGMYNEGSATIYDSIVSGNHAAGKEICYVNLCLGVGDGGGIYTTGNLAITNSTISGNSASGGVCPHCNGVGGGIYVYSGNVSLNNATLAGNIAVGEHAVGGGIYYHVGTTTLQNSIVANNIHSNCNTTLASTGYSLSSDTTCNFSGPGDINNINPLLGPLANNGGPTQTMALPTASPAIDAGNPAGCTDGLGHLLKTDQRGKPRPDKEDTGGCDIGAYESQTD